MTLASVGIPTAPVKPTSHFYAWLCGVAVVASGIQALFLRAITNRTTLSPGASFDTVQARLLVRGAWFVGPTTHVPSAAHQPLATLLFAIADVASATSPTSHRVFMAILFVASVVLAGITVRDLAGERAGILAALVFATFPFLWVNPATLGPETTVILVVSLLLFGAVRFWNGPSVANAALIGFFLGLCALTRTDLVALIVLVGLPLAILVRNVSWPERLRLLGVIVVLFALVVAPWVGRNIALLHRTALLSDDFGPVLAGANCSATSTGGLEGWWSARCLDAVPGSKGDESADVSSARTYVFHHLDEMPGVVAVKLGRLWNVYRPFQGIQLETGAGRPAWVSRLGLWYFAGAVPVAVFGAYRLRRRHLLLFPLVAMVVLSSVTAIVAYGDARFAVEADVALAMLAGVGLDALPIPRWGTR